MTLLSRDRARCIFCVTGLLQVACAFVVLGTNLAMRASDASCIVIDRDITEVVKSVVIPRRAADAKSDDASETPREKLMVEVAHGSIEVIVDAKANDTRIEAQFTVDGMDLKDAERRAQVVKLYAERSADGTIVVQPVFPGKAMARDSAKVTIRVPTCGDSSVKSVDGAISVRGITGALRVSTKSGSIKVTEHLGFHRWIDRHRRCKRWRACDEQQWQHSRFVGRRQRSSLYARIKEWRDRDGSGDFL